MKVCVIQPHYSFEEKAAETAKRCRALMFVNAAYRTENGVRNTTQRLSGARISILRGGFPCLRQQYGGESRRRDKPYFNQESVDKAHALGILCNVFYADDPEEAKRYREMGIDTILTNDYLTIANALKEA